MISAAIQALQIIDSSVNTKLDTPQNVKILSIQIEIKSNIIVDFVYRLMSAGSSYEETTQAGTGYENLWGPVDPDQAHISVLLHQNQFLTLPNGIR